MKRVEQYIRSETNVSEVHFTSDYSKYMKYTLTPNHRVLGAKLGAEYGKLRKGLMNLSDDTVK